jgi:hypothetical protein
MSGSKAFPSAVTINGITYTREGNSNVVVKAARALVRALPHCKCGRIATRMRYSTSGVFVGFACDSQEEAVVVAWADEVRALADIVRPRSGHGRGKMSATGACREAVTGAGKAEK